MWLDYEVLSNFFSLRIRFSSGSKDTQNWTDRARGERSRIGCVCMCLCFSQPFSLDCAVPLQKHQAGCFVRAAASKHTKAHWWQEADGLTSTFCPQKLARVGRQNRRLSPKVARKSLAGRNVEARASSTPKRRWCLSHINGLFPFGFGLLHCFRSAAGLAWASVSSFFCPDGFATVAHEFGALNLRSKDFGKSYRASRLKTHQCLQSNSLRNLSRLARSTQCLSGSIDVNLRGSSCMHTRQTKHLDLIVWRQFLCATDQLWQSLLGILL